MKKNKSKILGCIIVLIGSLFISACDNNTIELTEQQKIYNLYVKNTENKGEIALSYEEWMASIKGEKGDDGITPTITIGTDNHWYINGNDSGVIAIGENGGDGKGIVSIVKTNTNSLIDTYTITYTDDTTSILEITNGKNGEDGLSAYDIYIKYNPSYNKSESEWINDLVKGELTSKEEPTLTELYNESVMSVVRILTSNSVGSGLVYKEDEQYAYIITNAHVLSDLYGNNYTSSLEVVFSNFTRVKAHSIYYDRNEDIAVIRVNKSNNYKVAKIIENDSNVNIGEQVYSIGNPNGNYFSMTTGYISDNRIKTTTDYISGSNSTKTYVYNSSATINPGNSGGPLFNSKGEVIAINSMKPSDYQLKTNHNYSIPINYFIKVANYISTNLTTYNRPTLNIVIKSLFEYTTTELNNLGITTTSGVYVTSSTEPGLENGKIITHINGKKVRSVEDYEFELLKCNKNATIELNIVDKNGLNTKSITLTTK